MKLDILAIGVHPDDVELGCSGTLLRHIDEGKVVGVLDLTRGELGTRGSAEIRDMEAAASAKILGLAMRENAGMADGFFQHTEENLRKIITVLRHYKPDVVLVNAIQDRHPDHGRAAKLSADACFLAGLIKIKTEREGKEQEAWRPKNVYHYIQDYYVKPDFVIDITPYYETKLKAILAFSTQFFNKEADGPSTPISGQEFLDFLEGRARDFGRPAGITFAEGFSVTRPPSISSLFDIG